MGEKPPISKEIGGGSLPANGKKGLLKIVFI